MSVVVRGMGLITLPFSFPLKETLRAAEVQLTCAVQTLPVSTCGAPFFSRWKDPKTHSESLAPDGHLFHITVEATSCMEMLASPLCVSVGQGLPEATAPQDACQPPS